MAKVKKVVPVMSKRAALSGDGLVVEMCVEAYHEDVKALERLVRESNVERARLLAWAEQLRRDARAWRTWCCGRRRKRPCESADLMERKADAMETEARGIA